VTEVDSTEQHFPAAHCQCGGGEVIASSSPYRRHQIFDIPAKAHAVDGHQLYGGACEQCGDKNQAQLPQTLTSGLMGPNVLAFVAVQAGQFHQSITKIQQQLEQNFGLRFSRGAISEAQGRVSAMLPPLTMLSSKRY
jgi:transposase